MGSQTAEKNSAQTNRQTDRQTDTHYENNGHLAVNQYRHRPTVAYTKITVGTHASNRLKKCWPHDFLDVHAALTAL